MRWELTIWSLRKVKRYDLSEVTRERGTCDDRDGHLRRCDVTTKPKHIAIACIDIRGLPPDNGDERVSVVNSYADWFSRRPA
jgi:hypothetical protein